MADDPCADATTKDPALNANIRATDAHKSMLTLPEALWKIAQRPYLAEGMQHLRANLPWGTRTTLLERPDDEHAIFQHAGFEIGPLLGRGTFSRVVMAYWTQYRQNVAVKFYTKRREFRSMAIQALLPTEIEMLKTLKHPHIVAFYGAIETKHRVYLIMELVGCGNLLEYLMKNDRVPEPQAKIWFAQLLSAIKYAHDLEIAHRDIKLENILLDMSNNVRITDFGFATPNISWSEETPNSEWSKVTDSRGSRGYMAPELIFGEPHNPLLADVWAMGIVLYAILFGKFPIGLCTPETLNRMVKHFHVPLDPRISQTCEDALRKIFQFESQRIRSIDLLKCEWIADCEMSVDLGKYGKYSIEEAKVLKERDQRLKEENEKRERDLRELRGQKPLLSSSSSGSFSGPASRAGSHTLRGSIMRKAVASELDRAVSRAREIADEGDEGEGDAEEASTEEEEYESETEAEEESEGSEVKI